MLMVFRPAIRNRLQVSLPRPASCAALDVRPRISGRYRLKFKAQALPQKNHLGGYRMLYSHNCKFGVSQVHEDDRLAMPTLVRVLPALAP
jgi:hypothetical protein